MFDQAQLPPYQLRKSSRARHMALKITSKGQLEVVVPSRYTKREGLQFLCDNLNWVNRREHLLQAPEAVSWPTQLNLKAIDCQWPLVFKFGSAKNRLRECFDQVQISLIDEDLDKAALVVHRWLKRKSQFELTPWLESVSKQTGLRFNALSFRGQKTQWGNCSRQGDICLNYKLLLLPRACVHYVMVHELCHTVHFNHSEKFWSLVEMYIPDWKAMRYRLRRADRELPQWLR